MREVLERLLMQFEFLELHYLYLSAGQMDTPPVKTDFPHRKRAIGSVPCWNQPRSVKMPGFERSSACCKAPNCPLHQ